METKGLLSPVQKMDWMTRRAKVTVFGKKGIITEVQENRIKNIDCVYYIWVQLEGEKRSFPFHPSDVEELK